MAHPLGDAFWPNNRSQTNRNSVKTLTKTGPYQTSTAEFRLNYIQLIGMRLQVIKVRCQGGRHKLRGDWFLPSAKSDIHRPTQVLGKLQGCAQTLRQQIRRSRFDNFVKRRVVCGTLIQQPFEIGSGILI